MAQYSTIIQLAVVTLIGFLIWIFVRSGAGKPFWEVPKVELKVVEEGLIKKDDLIVVWQKIQPKVILLSISLKNIAPLGDNRPSFRIHASRGAVPGFVVYVYPDMEKKTAVEIPSLKGWYLYPASYSSSTDLHLVFHRD